MKNVLFTNLPGVKCIDSNSIMLEILLPKGWELTDFDKTENLFEIQVSTDGGKFWTPPEELLRAIPGAQIGLKMKVVNLDKGIMVDSWLSAFIVDLRKKRNYLQAYFRPFGKIESVDNKTVYAQIQGIVYDGLFVPDISSSLEDDMPF